MTETRAFHQPRLPMDDAPTGEPRRVTLAHLFQARDTSFCVVDTETMGWDSASDRVWEIGAVRFGPDRRETGRFHAVLNTGLILPDNILRLCGVTQEEVDQTGRDPKVVWDEFAAFASDSTLIAYGAEFDWTRIRAEYARFCPSSALPRQYACALSAARWYLPNLRAYDLGSVTRHLSIDNAHSHRALSDAIATADLVLRLANQASDPHTDPLAETVCAAYYETLYGWRRATALALGDIPRYLVLSNREVGEVARLATRNWQQGNPSLIGAVRRIGEQRAIRVSRHPADDTAYLAIDDSGTHTMVTLNPLWCQIDGPPDPWPCAHIKGTARAMALEDEAMASLAVSRWLCPACWKLSTADGLAASDARCCGETLLIV